MKKKLEILLKENPNTITAQVVQEALDSEDPKWWFNDLLQYGCQSWMVWQLIYYKDTHAFYDKYYNEIEDIRYQLNEDLGWDNSHIDSDLKNWYAWMSFEHIAFNIYNQLEEE